MEGEDDQVDQVTRRHSETPLVVRLLGAHQAQAAVAAVFSIEVKGHCWKEAETESTVVQIPGLNPLMSRRQILEN